MPRADFRDAVTHFINLHRRTEDSLEKQDTERQRKLVQMQLDDDRRAKEEVQAPVVGAPTQAPWPDLTPAPVYAPLPLQQPLQPASPPQLIYGLLPPTYVQPYWVQLPLQGWQAPVQQYNIQYNGNGPPTCWSKKVLPKRRYGGIEGCPAIDE